MNFLDKLERKFGKYAIKNLIIIIIALTSVVYILCNTLNYDLTSKMALSPALIMKGEIWRLISFTIIPPSTNLIFAVFALYIYYLIGSGLEHELGSFKFNIYYFVGLIGAILAAFISGSGETAFNLNMSLFLAFSYIYPDFELLIFFIIPVKVKYLGWLAWSYFAFIVIFGTMSNKFAAIFALINFFLFFGKDIINGISNKKTVYTNRNTFKSQIPKSITRHRCTVCGKTENDDPNLDFRYCSKCEGDFEYCMDHLTNHEHIKKHD